jgi:hypothetical protein
VHVHVSAFRIAQTDGFGLRAAAEQLLAEQRRQIDKPP